LELNAADITGPDTLPVVVELRHLRYFVAVAEELNFSRAAERLHMAQPPLSVAIRQLEQELGGELFVRTTHEVILTEAGRAVLEGARRTLTEVDHTIAAAKRAAAGELGALRVAFSWSAHFETLPAIGQAIRALHSDVELLTEEIWNARMPQALRSGAVDIAVALCPEIAGDLSYETPASVARQLPSDAVAVPISDPADRLETCMVWRTDHIVPAAAALRKVAGTVFGIADRSAAPAGDHTS
jgi:hypothetical protein